MLGKMIGYIGCYTLLLLSNSNAFIFKGSSFRGHFTLNNQKDDNMSCIDKSTFPKDMQSSLSRRNAFKRSLQTGTAGIISLTSKVGPANASSKSRTENYPIQRSEREWAYVLSGQQYNILRQGGTERPNSSILEGEERDGVYKCAACATSLFDSKQKFHSGTGWPSFAESIKDGVEIEDVNVMQKNLVGAELRCSSCGGHLGDVFMDGFLYVNTPAFKSGKRFCIDGAALVFEPSDGSTKVFGDTPPPKRNELPSFLEPPKINSRAIGS